MDCLRRNPDFLLLSSKWFRNVLTGLLLLWFAAAAGCSSEPTQNTADTADHVVYDALGRPFPVGKTYQKVITIAPGATEIVASAGGLDRLIGVSNVDSYPEEVRNLPSFSVLPMDFEAIVSLQPDLVFASSQVNDPKQISMFESLGLDIFFLDGSTWPSVFESIAHAGALLGTSAVADSTQSELSRKIQHITDLTQSVDPKPSALFLISAEVNYSFGSGSYVQDILSWAGVESLTESFETPAPNLSDEWVLVADPEIIFGSFEEGTSAATLLEHHPTWTGIRAIRNQRIVSVTPDWVLRPGPRNVDAAYEMARAAHPTLRSLLDQTP